MSETTPDTVISAPLDIAVTADYDKTPPTKEAKVAKATDKKKKKKKKVAAKPKATFKNVSVKLTSIVLPDDWNRDKLGDISGLVASLSDEGQLMPIVVRPGPTVGTYILVDGRRRLAALHKMGAATVMVTFSTAVDDGKAFLQSMVANLAREDNTPYEIARSFGKLVDNYSLTNDKIAKACGRTAGYVSQHLAVLKADSKLQSALKKGTISLAMFRHFAKIDQGVEGDFYTKMMSKAFSGASAQVIGDSIDTYFTRKVEKEAKAAAKKGEKAPKAAVKKGAAAHKSKKGMPKLNIPDYLSTKIYKSMSMVKKKTAAEWMDTYRDKALKATTVRKRDQALNVLEGMEILTGLLGED